MPRYEWKAITPEGVTRRGIYEAPASGEVAARLHREGLSVISISERKFPPTNLHIERISRRDLINFTYKLLPLVASHLTMHRVLDVLSGQVKKRRIKNALILMRQDVNNGASLSETMVRHPDIFNKAYLAAVRAGEESGDLVPALSMMVAFMEWLDETIKELWAVVSYPILVLVALTVLSMVLAFYAIPTFMGIYEQLNLMVETPLPTKIVFWYSETLRSYWYVLAAIFGAVFIIFLLRKRVPRLRLWLHHIALKMPYLGDIIRRIQSLQFCRFFQLLYDSGVEIQRSLSEAQGVLTNLVMIRAVSFIARQLESGVSVSDAFARSGQFPALVAEQLAVGEESGKIGEALGYVRRYYEFELNYSIKRFTTFLRPALVAVLAIVLLVLALGFYLPLFEIATLIEQ